MIPSSRLIIPPVAITVFTWQLFCFVRFCKVNRMDGHLGKQWSLQVVTVGRPSGSIDQFIRLTEYIARQICDHLWCRMCWQWPGYHLPGLGCCPRRIWHEVGRLDFRFRLFPVSLDSKQGFSMNTRGADHWTVKYFTLLLTNQQTTAQ